MQDTRPARLDRIALFEELPEETLRSLEQQCTWRRYEKAEQILGRDSDNHDVYFVVEGSVQIANYSMSGREIALAAVKAGTYFGELSAIDKQPRSASVIAAEKTLLAAMAPNVFRKLIASSPEVGLCVLEQLAQVVRACDERIMDLSTLGAVQRVYVELLRLAGPDVAVPRLWSIYPMPTQAEIAGRASTTRETVARVLSQLTSGEIVKRKGKTLYLQDRPKLQAMTERLEREQRIDASR